MKKIKILIATMLSAIVLVFATVFGGNVDAATTTYTADFKSGSLVNSTNGYFTAAKGSSAYSSSANCTATFTSIINGNSYSSQKGCKMEASTTITFTTTATSTSTVTILWGANGNAATDVNFDSVASSTKTAANKTNTVTETWTNVAAGTHTIGRGASGNQAVIFEVKVVETINQAEGTYNVTYNTNDHGSAQDAEIGVTSLPSSLPILSEKGWTFGGWYTDSSLETPAVAGKSITADTTLYAKWTKNADEWCTITFDANGGTCSKTTDEAVYGSEYTLPTATKEGYAFTGWNDGTKTYTTSITIPEKSDLTLTAEWIDPTITVSDANILTNGMINELFTKNIVGNTKITKGFNINDSIYTILENDLINADVKTISSELGKSTHSIKSGGKFNNAKNGLGINAPESGKLTVYARANGSNGTEYAGQLFNSSYAVVSTTEYKADTAEVVAFEFTIDTAGQYYFGNEDGGFYIYYAEFTPNEIAAAATITVDAEKNSDGTQLRFITTLEGVEVSKVASIELVLYKDSVAEANKNKGHLYMTSVYTSIANAGSTYATKTNKYYGIVKLTNAKSLKSVATTLYFNAIVTYTDGSQASMATAKTYDLSTL